MGYLVIGRKLGERIKIGADIEIIISDIYDGKVDIGVDAPRNLKIIKMPTHVEEQKKQGAFRREFKNKN